jgi:hypothetical protein
MSARMHPAKKIYPAHGDSVEWSNKANQCI